VVLILLFPLSLLTPRGSGRVKRIWAAAVEAWAACGNVCGAASDDAAPTSLPGAASGGVAPTPLPGTAIVVGPISLPDAVASGAFIPLLGAAAACTPLEVWFIFSKRFIVTVSSSVVSFE
jgi:hypothetical protein